MEEFLFKTETQIRRTGSNNNSGSQFKQYKFSAVKGGNTGNRNIVRRQGSLSA